jgi:hypothetical protein
MCGNPWYRAAHRAFCAVCGWARVTAPSDPKNLDGAVGALEVPVTRDQGCLPGLGEGGGEAGGRGKPLLEPLAQDPRYITAAVQNGDHL